MTINELVAKFRPNYVAVNNPKIQGIPTLGTTLVDTYEVEYDESDGVMLWVNIK